MRIIPLRVSTTESEVDDGEYDGDSDIHQRPNNSDRISYYVDYIRGLFCGTGSSLLPRSILCMMGVVIFLLLLSIYTSLYTGKRLKSGSSHSVWVLLGLVLPSVCLLFGLFYLCRTYFATNLDRSFASLYSVRSLPYIHRPVRPTQHGNSRQNMSLHMAALTIRVMSHMLEQAEGDPEALERLASEGVTHERMRALRLLLTDRDFTNEDYDALLALEEIVASQPGDPGHSGATQDEIHSLPTYTYTESLRSSKINSSSSVAASSTHGDYVSIPIRDSLIGTTQMQPSHISKPPSSLPQYCSSSELLDMDDDDALQLAISLSLSESGKVANSSLASDKKTLPAGGQHPLEAKRQGVSPSSELHVSNFAANVSDASVPSEEADSNTCTICLDEYQDGDQLRILPCLHIFHTCCIDNWLPRNSTCPVCKMDINDPIWRATMQSTLEY